MTHHAVALWKLRHFVYEILDGHHGVICWNVMQTQLVISERIKELPVEDLLRQRCRIICCMTRDKPSDAIAQGCAQPLSSHGSCHPINVYCTEGDMQLWR